MPSSSGPSPRSLSLVEKRFSPSIIIRFQQTRVASILHEGTVWLLSGLASVGENTSLSGNRRAQRHSPFWGATVCDQPVPPSVGLLEEKLPGFWDKPFWNIFRVAHPDLSEAEAWAISLREECRTRPISK